MKNWLLAGGLACLGLSAKAESNNLLENAPAAGGDERLAMHLHWDNYLQSTQKATHGEEEVDRAWIHAHFNLTYKFTDKLQLHLGLKVEEYHDHGGHGHEDHDEDHEEEHEEHGGNRYFEDHVLVAEELFLSWNEGDAQFIAGKFNPVVGINIHAIPGYLGYEQVEEYAILERVGFGVNYNYDLGQYGALKLSTAAFQADRSFLSGSVFYEREHNNIEDGGLANHGGLKSYSVALHHDAFDILSDETLHQFGWGVGYASQYGDGDETVTEDRVSVHGKYTLNLVNDLSWYLISEFTRFDNFGGHEGHDRDLIVTGSSLNWKSWELAGSYTVAEDRESGESDDTSYTWQSSFGYYFNNGVRVLAGYKVEDEGAERKEGPGLLIGWSGNF